MTLPLQVIWFKRDLRIEDHAPLAAAAAAGAVLPLYIIEPDYWQLPDVSRRHWHFIHDSLLDLQVEFAALQMTLAIRISSTLETLESIRLQYGSFTLWSHEETGNHWTYERDKAVAVWCQQHGIVWHEFPSNGVVRRLKNRDHWSKQRAARIYAPLVTLPANLTSAQAIKTHKLPAKEDPLFGTDKIGHVQKGGIKQARYVLDSFLHSRCQRYLLTISKPGVSARHCSRLSAHIAYGNLSIRQIEQAVKIKLESLSQDHSKETVYLKRNLNAFLTRLVWRCHFVQKLEQQPEMETRCLHPVFEGMREPYFNPAFLTAWQEGKTGYPLVDACMRSLHRNGWINFRMRAMLVSFASYDLWLDWRLTAPFLARLFTDYEPGIHYAQFQMQSGVTGMNAIRLYNPIKQSEEHDPEGVFIRKYVPELKDVPEEFIHEPWLMAEPPDNYPAPIVDHEIVSRFAREQIKQRRQAAGFKTVAKKLVKELGSRRKKSTKTKKLKPDKNPSQLDLLK